MFGDFIIGGRQKVSDQIKSIDTSVRLSDSETDQSTRFINDADGECVRLRYGLCIVQLDL